MLDAKKFVVSGHVQGVYYRASAQKVARELQLTGWVRNLPDGRVESVAMGETAALEKFERWLWQGPQDARVDAVVAEPVHDVAAAGGLIGFDIRRD